MSTTSFEPRPTGCSQRCRQQAGGVNAFCHHREPASIDDQPVIRQNRDTLYSSAIVDISAGSDADAPRCRGPLPVGDGRQQRPLHQRGAARVPAITSSTVDQFDTDYVLVAARILVDPDDPADLAAVNAPAGPDGADGTVGSALRDARLRHGQLRRDPRGAAHAGAGRHSRSTTRSAARTRSTPSAPARHGRRAGAACPSRRRSTSTSTPASRPASTRSPSRDVPVDGFWSISVYNADGYFEPNDRNAYSVNNITATPERRRLGHGALRRLRRRPTELPADHGRLELRRAPVPTTTRDPRRHLDLPSCRPCLAQKRRSALLPARRPGRRCTRAAHRGGELASIAVRQVAGRSTPVCQASGSSARPSGSKRSTVKGRPMTGRATLRTGTPHGVVPARDPRWAWPWMARWAPPASMASASR